MRRVLVSVLLASTMVAAQGGDPVVGNWRGTLTSATGVESPIIITIVKKGDGYAGSTNGLNASSEAALKRVTINGAVLSIEAADDSKLGAVALIASLTAEGNTLKGTGTVSVGAQKFDVTLALQRRPRAEAIQPHVEQRIDYFVGRWKYEYVGAEYPPLSPGGRSGTMTLTKIGASNFVAGRLEGEQFGKPYQEQLSIELDPDTNMLAFIEKRPDGLELLSVASWRSPIAITFQTSPVQANGKIYQLRRLMSVMSPTSFDVTEEFSVDGGPFKRLGNGHYTKLDATVPVPTRAGAQTVDPMAATVAQWFTMIESEFVPLADAMPAEKYGFKPTGSGFKDVRTFGEQVKHVACANVAFYNEIEKKTPPDGCETGGPSPAKTKPELMAYLRESFAYAGRVLRTMTPANALEPAGGPYGGNSTRLGIATLSIWHASDHYGQLVVYLRMNGITPPASQPAPPR